MKLIALFVTLALLLVLTSHSIAQPADPISAKFVADAVEQVTGQRAHMSSDLRLLAGTRFEGTAITLRLVRDERASTTTAGVAALKLLEEAPAGSVVVAVLEEEKGFAVIGATFATLAKSATSRRVLM
jgi:regulator of RNase E activity RraA